MGPAGCPRGSQAQLTQYSAAIEAAEYVQLGDLREADETEIDELIVAVGMGKPAARRFRKALAGV